MPAITPSVEPSYYYLLIARTCVARSRRAGPTRSQALREAASHYLAKARPDRVVTRVRRDAARP